MVLSITCCNAEVLTCFPRGVFDINAALRDTTNGYAPHGAQVKEPDDQYTVDAHGLPSDGFSIDLDASQYTESRSDLGLEYERYPAMVSKHGRDILIFVAGVQRGDFDPQNLSITITLPSMEFVEVDRFLSLEEMNALGYGVSADDETMPGRSAINAIRFGNCRRSE
jgi:hypothetical protein